MTIDRKQLACFVVGAEIAPGQWRWGVLNEDHQWLTSLDEVRSQDAERAGVRCCNPSQAVRQASAAGLGVQPEADIVAYRLFQLTDSDECATVLSGRVLG